MFQRAVRLGAALAALLMLAGCATYGEGMDKALVQVEQGHYKKADQSVQKSLDPAGDDQLLYHLELGTINHLQGNYKKSNQHLEKAYSLADSLRSKQADDYLAAAMVSPRETTYMGSDVERVYICYYKALNYLMLAQQAPDDAARSDNLEGAEVELRRLDDTLSTMSFNKGNYKDVKDKEEKTFYQLLDLFQKFQGNWIDADWLVFRDDAYARYLAGVLYEKSGDLDDARISYEKAAKLYAGGYTKQYHLSRDMAEQAWFDAIRVMRESGGYEGEWQHYAKDKLSDARRAQLDDYGPDTAQVVVIQHLGMVPQRKELNLRLTALPRQHSLLLRPVLT
ncbi:MAG TPA: hypothetical protein VKA48_12675, partial [Gammaproteobacteria bacterium]|nr:hypothetical protein [Gammaproteobacteria bacterium]